MSSRSSIARRKTKQGRRRGTDLRKIRRLQFAFLGAAFTVAAAYLVVTEMTMSAASPEAVDIEVTSALPSNFETSALPRAHVVGSDQGGGYEWHAAMGALPLQRGITALELDDNGKITRFTTIYDSFQFPDQTYKSLVVLGAEQ